MSEASVITAAMIEVAQPRQTEFLPAIWRDVMSDLRDAFDVHFVCASFSYYLAKHLSTRTLVAVADSENKSYDLWVTDPSGSTVQHRWSAEEAGFEPLMAYTKPTVIDKLERPAVEIISSRLWLETRRNLLVAPVGGEARPYNKFPPVLLALIDPPDKVSIDPEVVQQIIDLMCVFLDRAQLRQEVDHRTVEFAVITDVSRALSSTLNIQQIYELLTGPIRQILNVETLSIGLVEALTGDIVFVDKLFGPMFERLPPIRLKRGQGIAGWVAEHQEPVIINNAYSDRRFFSGVDQRSGFRTSSMICIPLTVNERVIGVLQAINRQFGSFGAHDLELMESLGGPLAAAIENANLYAEVLSERLRVETLFSSIAEGLVSINRMGIITKANSAFSALLSCDPEGLTGSALRDCLRPIKTEIDELVDGVFAPGDDIAFLTAELPRPTGHPLPILITGTAIKDAEGSANEAFLLFSDLTQIREVERMRDDLFQGIVHEFRTPLATILMYARLLREGKVRHPEKSERFLGVIERESDRLQRMIKQLIEISKLDSPIIQRSPQPVWLNSLLDEALTPLADRAVRKGLLFRQRIEQELPPVMGSEEGYYLVLYNLLDNAIKFTPSGSVQIAAWKENGTVAIEISDEGIGIPPEGIKNLFKRFYRARTSVERGLAGTGLGLYMVKETLRHYNGKITVQSTVGKGSTFLLRLPIAPM